MDDSAFRRLDTAALMEELSGVSGMTRGSRVDTVRATASAS